jgi:hypothetical protein
MGDSARTIPDMKIGRLIALPALGAALAGALVIHGDTPKNAPQRSPVLAFDVEFYVEKAWASGTDPLAANSEKIARVRTDRGYAFAGDGYVNEGAGTTRPYVSAS